MSDELLTRIDVSSAQGYLKTLREVYLNFVVLEQKVFSHSNPIAMKNIFTANSADALDTLKAIASSLVSVCATHCVLPNIHYVESKCKNVNFSQHLSEMVDRKFKEFYELAKPTNFSSANLLIYDRSFDILTPIVRDFSYQAIVNDLLPIENGKKYLYKNSDDEEKTVFLDEEDSIWTTIRHLHLAECNERLAADFNEFEASNRLNLGNNIAKMQEAVSNLGDFQLKKEKFAIHISMATLCNKTFKQDRLEECSLLEQDMATGFDIDGNEIKEAYPDLVPLLLKPDISNMNKLRLLITYVISNRGIKDEDRRKILSLVSFSKKELDAVSNLAVFGVPLAKDPKEPKVKKNAPKEDADFDISRYFPPLMKNLQDFCAGTQNLQYFKSIPHSYFSVPIKKSTTSIRGSKPIWQARKEAPPSFIGEKTIVYILGGVTHAEIKAVYDISKKYKRDIIIGSTAIITPNTFIEELGKL